MPGLLAREGLSVASQQYFPMLYSLYNFDPGFLCILPIVIFLEFDIIISTKEVMINGYVTLERIKRNYKRIK